MSMNITTKQSHYNPYTIMILLFMYAVGPMRTSDRASNGTSVLQAGPGHSFCWPSRVCTTAAGPDRYWKSNHIDGPGLGLNAGPVQGPTSYLSKSAKIYV